MAEEDKGFGARAFAIAKETWLLFGRIEGGMRAASFAYYALFSIFPLFALLLTLGSTFVDPEQIISTAKRFFPMEANQQELVWRMSTALREARGGVGIVSVFALLWTSLGFFKALVQGVNRTWEGEPLSWWKLPLKNLSMMGVLVSALLLGMVLPAVLQAVEKALRGFEGFVLSLVPGFRFELVALVFGGSRFLLAGVLMFYALSLLYMLAPGTRVGFRRVWPAALSVAVALQGVQMVFSNYIIHIVNYNAIYGSVGALMLTLMWIYIAGFLILLGSCFCAASDRVARAGAPTPSTRGN
jgi:YihY family inner membrane protein